MAPQPLALALLLVASASPAAALAGQECAVGSRRTSATCGEDFCSCSSPCATGSQCGSGCCSPEGFCTLACVCAGEGTVNFECQPPEGGCAIAGPAPTAGPAGWIVLALGMFGMARAAAGPGRGRWRLAVPLSLLLLGGAFVVGDLSARAANTTAKGQRLSSP